MTLLYTAWSLCCASLSPCYIRSEVTCRTGRCPRCLSEVLGNRIMAHENGNSNTRETLFYGQSKVKACPVVTEVWIDNWTDVFSPLFQRAIYLPSRSPTNNLPRQAPSRTRQPYELIVNKTIKLFSSKRLFSSREFVRHCHKTNCEMRGHREQGRVSRGNVGNSRNMNIYEQLR
jgi:hypothetical protein